MKLVRSRERKTDISNSPVTKLRLIKFSTYSQVVATSSILASRLEALHSIMVKIGLSIKANLKNVDKFYPNEPETFSWPLKVKCTACFEIDPNIHLVSEDEVVEMATAKANFVYKCKLCQRENHLLIIPSNQVNCRKGYNKDNLDTAYRSEDEDKFKTIISFDCRGLELIDFEPGEGWAVHSGQKIFQDVDFSEKEWFDYNELDDQPVEITNFEHKFVTLK